MMEIRPAEQEDLNSFYAISLATGHLGTDASHLFDDPRMMGHIYSAPYLKFAPDLSFVAVDELGVAGFVVGAADTPAFERLLEDAWWSGLRAIYSEPDADARADWSADQRRSYMIHHPELVPAEVARDYPAHLHMNLLPRLQGRGIGPRLLKLWITTVAKHGVAGVHIGVNPNNLGALRFWQKNGFHRLSGSADIRLRTTMLFGREI